MRSCSDVHNYLLEQGVAHEIVQLPALSGTARRAAGLLGVSRREVVRSSFRDRQRSGRVPRAGRRPRRPHPSLRRVRLPRRNPAPAAQVMALTGYRPGALPPCGLAAELPIVADPGILELPVVYCGGGTTATMLKIRSADLLAVLGARVAAIAV